MKLNLKNIFILIRPHQYVKNLFIFMPLFFLGQITDVRFFSNALMAFVAFSFCASAIYILNDYHDIQEDRLHPQKKYRPLAAGTVSRMVALSLMGIFFIIGICLMAIISLKALYFLLGYIALNIAYSLYLKHVSLVDITIIAIGFVLRLFVGSAATNVSLSMWIIIMTFLLALFLALAKRRDDVLVLINTGKKTRKVVDGYSLQLIDSSMMIMASVVIVAYILFTTSESVIQRIQNQYLFATALFVILGIMRYLQITLLETGGGSPTKVVLTDRFMQTTILAWIFSFVWILYL